MLLRAFAAMQQTARNQEEMNEDRQNEKGDASPLFQMP